MQQIKSLLILLFALSISSYCSAQTNSNETKSQLKKAERVEVYYFHYSRRCATCNAVESVSQEAIKELYGNQVTFSSLNLDETAGELKGKELSISGQTLLIVSDDERINITNEGFMNARTNPDKLKQVIKEKIDPLI